MAVAAIELSFDSGLFTPDVIARTAHRYTGDFFVDVAVSSGAIVVRLTPKQDSASAEDVVRRFRNDALDDRLRAQVREQTGDVQIALLQAAFRAAKPRDD
jgi:His-Xaa-Ser system protein HxsD